MTTDTSACAIRNEHVPTTRHSKSECLWATKTTTGTDLTTVRDHPAVILTKGQNGYGANALLEYEREHGVTFVALDNEALQAVREEYALASQFGTEHGHLLTFKAAVADLLGLND